ncbi:plasmid stablization protein ParB [Roseovarius sp. 22II1-1F6A]|nr:plasmid stablization protein ParB [Roseovarius sp. 22II1-1F6A]
MARKNLLDNLTNPTAATPGAAKPATPRRTTGAIGAVSQSIADLRTRALSEVPSDMVDDAGLRDRLDEDPAGIAALKESIREYGQQVPVLLRHSPNYEGRYEIVYGRRRVIALKQLGLPVKAMIRDLNDRDLIVAQGQENTARKNLTFIEKANFARQMAEANFDRKVICDALHIDKTVISRMMRVTEAVPVDIIHAIGAAPSVGRDRWMALAERLGDRPVAEICAMAVGDSSDDRFQAVYDGLDPAHRPAPPKPAKVRPAPRALTGADGTPLGRVSQSGRSTVLTINKSGGFDDWLLKHLDKIHRDFLNERGE